MQKLKYILEDFNNLYSFSSEEDKITFDKLLNKPYQLKWNLLFRMYCVENNVRSGWGDIGSLKNVFMGGKNSFPSKETFTMKGKSLTESLIQMKKDGLEDYVRYLVTTWNALHSVETFLRDSGYLTQEEMYKFTSF